MILRKEVFEIKALLCLTSYILITSNNMPQEYYNLIWYFQLLVKGVGTFLYLSFFFKNWWFSRLTGWLFVFFQSLIPSSDMAPCTVSKLNTSSNLKQTHHALFSIPENLMMQNKVFKVSFFKRNLVFQLYLEKVSCIFYFELWLLYLVCGFFINLF